MLQVRMQKLQQNCAKSAQMVLFVAPNPQWSHWKDAHSPSLIALNQIYSICMDYKIYFISE